MGERVILRAWEREDARVRWEADQTPDNAEPRLRDWHEPPRSLAQREAEVDERASSDDSTVVALIIEAEGRTIGDINLFSIDERNRSASLGLSIWRDEDRGRGYGTDAVRALARWAFRHKNLHRIELSVAPHNERAIQAYQRVGFVQEGRRRESEWEDGRWVDDIIMGLLGSDFEVAEAARADTDVQAPRSAHMPASHTS
jgi:RimJ/RimL family protein N-acetyltransferase